MNFFSHVEGWLSLIGLGTGGLLAAAWWFGFMPILGAVAELVAKFLGPILSAMADVIVWLWQNVLWPGLRGMLDGIPQIATFSLIVGGLFLITRANDVIQLNHANRQVARCEVALKKARRSIPREAPPQLWEFKFPWQ